MRFLTRKLLDFGAKKDFFFRCQRVMMMLSTIYMMFYDCRWTSALLMLNGQAIVEFLYIYIYICIHLYIFSHSRRIFGDSHALQRWKTTISLRFHRGELNGLPVGHMRHGNINAALDLGGGCLLWDSNLPKIAAGFGSCVDATFSKVKSFCDSSGNLKAGALPWYPSQWYLDFERRNPLGFDIISSTSIQGLFVQLSSPRVH